MSKSLYPPQLVKDAQDLHPSVLSVFFENTLEIIELSRSCVFDYTLELVPLFLILWFLDHLLIFFLLTRFLIL